MKEAIVLIGQAIAGFLLVVLAVALVAGAVVALVIPVQSAKCHARAEIYGVESNYAFLSGCNYRVDGIWIDSDQYAVVVLGERS